MRSECAHKFRGPSRSLLFDEGTIETLMWALLGGVTDRITFLLLKLIGWNPPTRETPLP